MNTIRAYGLVVATLLVVVLMVISQSGLRQPRHAVADEKAAHQSNSSIPSTNSIGTFPTRFPDYNLNYVPQPKDYDGPKFRLSQDYPQTAPPIDDKLAGILKLPFQQSNADAMKFLIAIRDYCFEGNLDVNWQGQDNPVRKWYHVPWQHWGANGREAIHGLTKEATAKPQQLAPTQTNSYQSYAVGMYNANGGYTLGQVWKDPYNPNPSKGKFAIGTVVAKILFTQATTDQVPYLNPPIGWKAYAQTSDQNQNRTVQTVNLMQMDVMIRVPDELKTPTGWIFGNYCYNGAVGSKILWENLVPNGLQWGDDPTVTSDPRMFNGMGQPFPPQTVHNPDLKQTVINDSPQLPPQHLGWGGRLNGPLDYYNSSCMSCHSTAQYPQYAPQNPAFSSASSKLYPIGSEGWMIWFRNLGCGEPFGIYPPHATPTPPPQSMDFSLQLAIGLSNFEQWQQLNGGFAPKLQTTRSPQPTRPTVHPILRDAVSQ